MGIHSFCFHPSQASYVNSLFSLQLLPTNLEQPASFFGLSLPSEFKDQFQILPGNLPGGLQTNTRAVGPQCDLEQHLRCEGWDPYP